MGKREYTRSFMKRIFVVSILILFAAALHRIFASLLDRDLMAGLLFIIVFTAGLFYYYISLFKSKRIPNFEFILSIILILFLTIIMFAIIYSEPSTTANNYFIEEGNRINLGFSDALYFSTSTITTLGSDISPRGFFRFFVMAEVILGLIYMGIIVYFITKAVENK